MAPKPLPDQTGTYVFDQDVMDEMQESEPTIDVENEIASKYFVDTLLGEESWPDDEFLDDINDANSADLLDED